MDPVFDGDDILTDPKTHRIIYTDNKDVANLFKELDKALRDNGGPVLIDRAILNGKKKLTYKDAIEIAFEMVRVR